MCRGKVRFDRRVSSCSGLLQVRNSFCDLYIYTILSRLVSG